MPAGVLVFCAMILAPWSELMGLGCCLLALYIITNITAVIVVTGRNGCDCCALGCL